MKRFFWSWLLGLAVVSSYAQDTLKFKNGDVVTGRYLGQSETIIFFDSEIFGVIKVPQGMLVIDPAELRNKNVPQVTEEPAPPPQAPAPQRRPQVADKPAAQPQEPEPVIENRLQYFWRTAEQTLSRVVNDRVPGWFPQLPEKWDGSLKFGFNYNDARRLNTRTYGEFNLERDDNNHNFNLKTYFAYAEQNRVTNEQDYGGSFRYRYKFGQGNFVESLTTVDIDNINEPDRRITESLGYGVSLLRSDRLKLDVVLGGALEEIQVSDMDSELNFRVSLNENFNWRFNKHLNFKQSLRVLENVEDFGEYYIRFDSGLNTLIIGALNLGITYRLDYDSALSRANRQKTRLVTSLGINF